MTTTQILFEPLPISRVGVAADTRKVIIANDYSCFGKMLEEYIAHGALSIAIPSSFPESKAIQDMPKLLQDRIRVVDDAKETDSVARLFHGLRCELGISVGDIPLQWEFPSGMPIELIKAVKNSVESTKRILLSYNYQLQAEVSIELATKSYRQVRKSIANPTTRIVLAQLEGLLSHYQKAEYKTCVPRSGSPQALVNMFDQLANDPLYIQYSEACAQMAKASARAQTLSRLRQLSRSISSKRYVGVVWDFATKIIKVWPGVQMPDSKELAIFAERRELPSFLNLQEARVSAVQDWRSSGLTGSPLNRVGSPLADGKVYWLPPLESMQVVSPHSSTAMLGSVSELLEALERARDVLAFDNEDPA